jgi:hypothetical protein
VGPRTDLDAVTKRRNLIVVPSRSTIFSNMTWIELALDRVEWRAFVFVMLNFRVRLRESSFIE